MSNQTTERAALHAQIISTVDALSPDYQIAAFFFAAMLSDDTEPHADPEQTECRMMIRAFRAKQAFEKTAADPDADPDERSKAIAYHDTVAPLIEAIRYHVDHLELIVDDELWPLPKYREMLFFH